MFVISSRKTNERVSWRATVEQLKRKFLIGGEHLVDEKLTLTSWSKLGFSCQSLFDCLQLKLVTFYRR